MKKRSKRYKKLLDTKIKNEKLDLKTIVEAIKKNSKPQINLLQKILK